MKDRQHDDSFFIFYEDDSEGEPAHESAAGDLVHVRIPLWRGNCSGGRAFFFPIVIPAQAGIQTGRVDVKIGFPLARE